MPKGGATGGSAVGEEIPHVVAAGGSWHGQMTRSYIVALVTGI